MYTVIPFPRVETENGLAGLLSSRRSTKSFDPSQTLSVEDVSTVMWAAAGSATTSRRVCPSARATNPLSITLVVGRVDGLNPGCYQYELLAHSLVPGLVGDVRKDIAAGTTDAVGWLAECPALLLLTADLHAARLRFPDQPADHGERFVWMEAGHSAQNVYLSAAEQQLGTCLVAGFDDEVMATTCAPLIPPHHRVLGILGLGHATT